MSFTDHLGFDHHRSGVGEAHPVHYHNGRISMKDMLGRTVALTLLPARSGDGEQVTLSGLYDVEDFISDERGSGFVLVRHDLNAVMDRHNSYDVDPDALWEQVDPQGYGRSLVEDRETAFLAEDFDKRGWGLTDWDPAA